MQPCNLGNFGIFGNYVLLLRCRCHCGMTPPRHHPAPMQSPSAYAQHMLYSTTPKTAPFVSGANACPTPLPLTHPTPLHPVLWYQYMPPLPPLPPDALSFRPLSRNTGG